jgi:hypothetical protein
MAEYHSDEQAKVAAGQAKARPNDSNDLIQQRRNKLRMDGASVAGDLKEDGVSDVWGLALSGGGIRSATFCLGLLRGLAKQKLLSRFDVLSTVSGGGYVGSMLGRLYDRERSGVAKPTGLDGVAAADRVEAAMADAESTWFGWWLRANGRYLAPAGLVDRLFAAAIYLRSLLALHFEFGLLAVLAGSLLAALDLGVWQLIAKTGYAADPATLFHGLLLLKPWLPTAWLLLAVVLPIALHLVFTYWDTQWVTKRFGWYCVGKAALGAVLMAAALQVGQLMPPSPPLQDTVAFVNVLPAIAAAVTVLLATSALHASLTWCRLEPRGSRQAGDHERQQDALAEMRNGLTFWLMVCLGITLLLLALGVAERLAWLLAFETRVFETLDLGILLAVISGAAQALMISLRTTKGRKQKPAGATSLIVPHLLQLVGYLLTAALLVCWVSLVLKVTFAPVFPHLMLSGVKPVEVVEPEFVSGWLVLLCIFVPPALYVTATGSNLGFLNLSSLHTFYKARLVRSYLGATNNLRFSGRGAISALEPIDAYELTTSNVRNVGKVTPEDDISLADYGPHLAGGPVHIINTCVNQTADPKGRLFNRDRKGLLFSVRAGGDSRLSLEGWRGEFRGIRQLSLGAWLAISGAAAAPGLGARTQSGLAALLTFAGVRLGYWLSPVERRGTPVAGSSFMGRALKGMVNKSSALLQELSAKFSAGPEDNWYVSDGGHFENTGVYALLLERASVIVLADCGADPGYSFEDVENLVRKARIDLDIVITFRQPRDPSSLASTISPAIKNAWSSSARYFGTLQNLADDENETCLALATVEYPGKGSSGPAILILVKPNTFRSVSMDVANYKRQNPKFPQEPTGDQFFSENQWESYFSLGTDLGRCLSAALIIQFQEHLEVMFDVGSDMTSSLPEASGKATPDQLAVGGASRSVWGRQVGAVGATLGAGAALSLAVAAWQSLEGHRAVQSSRVAGERAAMSEIAQLWEQLPPPEDTVNSAGPANRLAAALLRAGDAYCVKGEASWLIHSDFGLRMIADTVVSCEALKQMGSACQVIVEARSGLPALASGSCLVKDSPISAVYWGYDYSEFGAWNTMHPCSTRRDQLVEQKQVKGARTPEDLADIQEGCAGRSVASSKGGAGEMANSACKGKTIYMQIYGPDKRDKVRGFRSWWHDDLRASVPPIEDVVATAFRAARPAPAQVSNTTVRYHDEGGRECAKAIQAGIRVRKPDAAWQIEPLFPAQKGVKGVIEVWFSNDDPALK